MRYSEKEAFNSCPLKYKWTQEGLKKEKEDRSVHHLKWGQAIHAGLEAYYKGLPFPAVEKAFMDVYPIQLDQADTAKTVENGVEVLKQYVKHYGAMDQGWEVLATELEGLVGIGDEEHGLHIDLVGRLKQTGEIYFWDHKTSGKEPGVTYWKSFEISGQITRYTVYVQEKFGECAGCFINNIALKFLLRKNKYGEGPGLVVRFERQLFNRTPQQVEYWRRSDEDWMRVMEFCAKENVWPKALNTLCSYCEFYALCLASGDSQIKDLMYSGSGDFEVEVGV